MPIAETIPTRVEYYKFTGQPRREWPKWLKVFNSLSKDREGRIAVATYDTPDGKPEWYRWYDEDKFLGQFRQIKVAD